MGMETEAGVPSYLQPEPDIEEFNLPSAPTGHAAAPAGRTNAQVSPTQDYLPFSLNLFY